MNYSVGDKVLVIDNEGWGKNLKGKTAIVIRVHKNTSNTILSLRFDEYIDGHDCGNACKCGYGWNLESTSVIPAKGSITTLLYMRGEL